MDKVRGLLPVVTNEIGDTWIHGVASDAYKTAAMRVLMRSHARVVSSSATQSSPHTSPSVSSLPDGFAEFERLLLKCPEHTWGGDQKLFLHYGEGGDYFNWSNTQFQAAAADGEFDVLIPNFIPELYLCFVMCHVRFCRFSSQRMTSSVHGAPQAQSPRCLPPPPSASK
jgi:hypothetical protein